MEGPHRVGVRDRQRPYRFEAHTQVPFATVGGTGPCVRSFAPQEQFISAAWRVEGYNARDPKSDRSGMEFDTKAGD
jgi:hypothetical protein